MHANQWKRRGICAGLLWAALAGAAPAETVVGGINNWRPWSIAEGDGYGGILAEVFVEAVRRAGHEPELRPMPHKRKNEREWGKTVFVELGVLPEWRERFADVSRYTVPFVETQDVVLARKGTMAAAGSVEDFHGKRLGATLGYTYVDGFAEAFEAGHVLRDDAPEGPSLMRKLELGRVDGAILDRHEALYWMRTLGMDPEDYEVAYTFTIVSRLRMRLHPALEHLLPALDAALRSMEEDGTIRRIVEAYVR